MSNVTPRKPDPLPAQILRHREKFELKVEREMEVDHNKVAAARAWVREQLVSLYLAEKFGGGESDSDYMDRVDDTYNTIRNGLTRQELIYGFLTTVHDEAREEAAKQYVAFQQDLKEITGPEPV